MLYEYAPWSKGVSQQMIADSPRILTALDLQLGPSCNQNCVYCDTPCNGEPCSLNISAIERYIATGKIRWVYVCGLGEPTARGNMDAFKRILAICKEYNVKVSIFSNVVNLDEQLIEYIENGTLYVLFKLDTFNPRLMKKIYRADNSQTLLRNYQILTELVRTENGTTNLGASIVPTRWNYREIPSIIDWCLEHKIYPVIGQLERAGKGVLTFNLLKLSDRRLLKVKKYVETKSHSPYVMLICPAAVCGIHVAHPMNSVIVEKKTGFSCGWYNLESPKMVPIANISEMTLEEVTSKILDYRRSKLEDVIRMMMTIKPHPLGGCGGNVDDLVTQYILAYCNCN